MMRRLCCFWLTIPVLFASVLLGARDAAAVQVTNKSDKKIGAAVLRVKEGRKKTLFVKILQPNGAFDFTPPAGGDGSLLVSVKVFDTNQTLRIPDAAPDAKISYENGQLVTEKDAS